MTEWIFQAIMHMQFLSDEVGLIYEENRTIFIVMYRGSSPCGESLEDSVCSFIN